MYPDKNIKKHVDSIVPSICFFGRCLGFCPQESYIEQVGLSLFPKTTEDFILISLIQDMSRAYSGNPQPLTLDAVISKVGALLCPYRHSLSPTYHYLLYDKKVFCKKIGNNIAVDPKL